MPPIQTIWRRIEVWLAQYAPTILTSFQSGATEQELRDAEATLGVELPEDLKALYRLHNGSQPFLDGWGFYSLAGMVADWRSCQEVFLQVYRHEDIELVPTGPLRPVMWYPKWIPFMWNGLHDRLCLDLAPGPGGQQGQVVYYLARADLGPPLLLAPSLAWYLAFCATELEEGEYGLDQFGAPVSEDRLSLVPLRMGAEQYGSLLSTHELIERVASRVGTSQEESASTVEALLSVLVDTLKAGEEVRLVGFGSFRVSLPVVFTTIDPHTGATRAAPTAPSVRFHSAVELQEAVSSA